MTKLHRSFFRPGKGQPEVIKGQIWSISTFFDKLAQNWGTRRATVMRKDAFGSSFVLSPVCLKI